MSEDAATTAPTPPPSSLVGRSANAALALTGKILALSGFSLTAVGILIPWWSEGFDDSDTQSALQLAESQAIVLLILLVAAIGLTIPMLFTELPVLRTMALVCGLLGASGLIGLVWDEAQFGAYLTVLFALVGLIGLALTTGQQGRTLPGSTGTGQAPGWYADPTGQQQLRYWDGSDWTEHAAS